MPATNPPHRTTFRTRALAPAAAVVALAFALAGVDPAAAINRCEGRDGRITYTDEPCPATARAVRKVDDSPPVQARSAPLREAAGKDAKDGKADPAADDGKATAADGKGVAPAGGVAGPGVAAPALQAGRITATTSTDQDLQRLDELRERQRRQCDEAKRRVDYATKDLQAAVGPERASAELVLRRAQEAARGVCPPR